MGCGTDKEHEQWCPEVIELNKIIAKLREENERLRELMESNLTGDEATIHAKDRKILEQLAEIKRLREALAFYANEKNHIGNLVDIGVGNQEEPCSSDVYIDRGKIAREALQTKEGESGKI